MDVDILVEDVLDDAWAATSWVCLNVNSFEWVVEFNISEGDIPHTIYFIIGRNWANGHANSPDDLSIFN